MDPAVGAVGGEEPVFGSERLAVPIRPLVGLEGPLAVLGVQVSLPEVLGPAPLLQGVAEDVLDLGADVELVGVGGDRLRIHDGGDVLDERPVAFFRCAQTLLDLLLLGDVEHRSLPEAGVAVRVADEDGLVVEPHDVPVLRDHAVVLPVGLARACRPLRFAQHGRVVVGVQPLQPEAGHRPLLRRVAQDGLDLRADVGVERRSVVGRFGMRLLVRDGGGLFHDGTEPFLGLAALVLGAVALRHVGHEPQEMVHGPVRTQDRRRRVVHPDDAPVGSSHAVLVIEGCEVTGVEGPDRLQTRLVVGMDQARPELRIVHEPRNGITEDLLDLRTHESHPDPVGGGDVGVGDGGDALHEVSVAILGIPPL